MPLSFLLCNLPSPILSSSSSSTSSHLFPCSTQGPLSMAVFYKHNPRFPFFLSLFSFLFLNLSLSSPLFPANDSPQNPPPPDIGDITSSTPSPPPPPHSPPHRPDISPFKPGIAVIVGVLTTIFSITFLLLLYAKHCKGGHTDSYHGHPSSASAAAAARKNSGIDRAVIESLPIFRFGSLRGQKDGLECAVCLTRFEPAEVLRLLPKCKHAFHVECVDTWLDAHSTCPLCRYRVDPEDVLLIGDSKILHENQLFPIPQLREDPESRTSGTQSDTDSAMGFHRISGRHSSAGERASLTQIVVQRPGDQEATSFRRSLDSLRKKSELVAVRCFDRPRKDGLLLTDGLGENRTSVERRLEHRIIVASGIQFQQRWSDVQPSDLLYLRSEMIISESRRFNAEGEGKREGGSGRSVITGRSVSEITGMSRFSSRVSNNNRHYRGGERERGVVSRWLAWISSQSHPVLRSHHTPTLI